MDSETLKNLFLKDLAKNGLSANTIKNYDFYLTRFLEFADFPSIKKINTDLIQKYKIFLRQKAAQKDLKINTQNYHLIALRSFLKYLSSRGFNCLSGKNVFLGKMPPRKIEFIEGGLLEKFLSAPLFSSEEEIIKLRDKAILELLCATGLKVSELSFLERAQLDIGAKTVKLSAKGKIRVIFLPERTFECIKKYFDKRTDHSSAFFLRHDRAKNNVLENITPRTVQRIVKKYSNLASLYKNLTPQALRNSFAMHLFSRGRDLQFVKEALGHKSMTSTQFYNKFISKGQTKKDALGRRPYH